MLNSWIKKHGKLLRDMRITATVHGRHWKVLSGTAAASVLLIACTPLSTAAPTLDAGPGSWKQQALRDTSTLVAQGSVAAAAHAASHVRRAVFIAMLGSQVDTLAHENMRDLQRTHRRTRLRDSIRRDIDSEHEQSTPERRALPDVEIIAQATGTSDSRLTTSAERSVSASALVAPSAGPVSRLLDRSATQRFSTSTKSARTEQFDGVSTTLPDVERPRRRHGRRGIRPTQQDQNTSVVDESPISIIDNTSQVTKRLPGERPAPTLRNQDSGGATRAPARQTTGR
jgi:hypothetical protein